MAMSIGSTASLYNKVLLSILLVLTLAGWGVMETTGLELLAALAVSVTFSLACSLAYIQAWKAVARRSPETLPKLYLAGSAFRLMAAAMVVLVCCVVWRHDVASIRNFAAVFIAYYLALLVFDAIFFAKVSKKQ